MRLNVLQVLLLNLKFSQHNTCSALTGPIRRTSKEKLYEEVGLDIQ